MSAVYTPPEVAGNAVDGIYIPGPSDLEEENVARTDWERNPWRRVDLQADHCIIALNILTSDSKFVKFDVLKGCSYAMK